MKCRSRSYHIKGILPNISTDRGIVIEDNQCLSTHGVACLYTGLRTDIETDITYTMFLFIINRQKAHLGARRFRTRSGVDTLENPEQLMVNDIYTGSHIHPDAQGVGDI